MIFIQIPTGMFASNCYIIGDQGAGVVIDPGVSAAVIVRKAEEAGLKMKYIILTHAHIDHMISMDALREATGARVMVHEEDAPALADSIFNGSALFSKEKLFEEPDVRLKDGDTVHVGGLTLEIIHTPGHSPGGICIKVENSIFTGDTLFRMSVGRTDLGFGDYNTLMHSLTEKLMKLPAETVVYPGHGPGSTIGYEKRHNPYIEENTGRFPASERE